MRKSFVFLTLAITALLGACTPVTSEGLALSTEVPCQGVTVAVNFGILEEEPAEVCVTMDTDTAITSNVLEAAGYETQGTLTYGDQIVCRVNGLPSESEPFLVEGEAPHSETCSDMPPGFAYWALWIKNDGAGEWAYAEEGVGTLELVPGDSIGLAFSTGGETPLPSSE